MENVVFSKHALEQMELRNIPVEIVEAILNSPQQTILELEKKIFQSIVNFENEGEYLVRIFVNINKQPNLVITVYKTSKIEKYHES